MRPPASVSEGHGSPPISALWKVPLRLLFLAGFDVEVLPKSTDSGAGVSLGPHAHSNETSEAAAVWTGPERWNMAHAVDGGATRRNAD